MEAWYQQLREQVRSLSRLRIDLPDLPKRSPYTLELPIPTDSLPNLLRPHIALYSGTGILTCFPSTTHFCLALGADSPCADERCAGNLGLSVREPFTPFIATHVSIRTSDTSSILHKTPSQAYRTLSYHISVPFNTRTSCRITPRQGWDATNLQLRRRISPDCSVRGVLRRVASRNFFACPKRNADIRDFGA